MLGLFPRSYWPKPARPPPGNQGILSRSGGTGLQHRPRPARGGTKWRPREPRPARVNQGARPASRARLAVAAPEVARGCGVWRRSACGRWVRGCSRHPACSRPFFLRDSRDTAPPAPRHTLGCLPQPGPRSPPIPEAVGVSSPPATMFVLVEMTDTVRIPPWQFERKLNESIAEELNKKLANKVKCGSRIG